MTSTPASSADSLVLLDAAGERVVGERKEEAVGVVPTSRRNMLAATSVMDVMTFVVCSFLSLLASRRAVEAGRAVEKNFTPHNKKNDLHHDASHPKRPHYTSKCRHSKVIIWCLDQLLPLNSTVLSAARHHEHKETFDHHSSGSGFDPPPLQCNIVSSIKHHFSEINNKPVCRDGQYDKYKR